MTAATLENWRTICRQQVKIQPYPRTGPGTLPDSGLAFVRSDLAELLQPGQKILDVGSGHGRLAMGLHLAGHQVEYVGLEPIGPAVLFCRRLFAGIPGFTFRHVPVRNDRYTPDQAADAATWLWPVPDGSVDLVVLASVFTHLATPAAAVNYLANVQRVLRPGGRAWLSCFLSPPNRPRADADRTVYRAAWFHKQIREAGLELIGSSGGTTDGWHDSRRLTCQKPGPA